MCVSPVLIPNPNYHSNVEIIKLTTDTENQFLRVPCNHCSECIALRQSSMVQRVRCLSLDHYIFFSTLTYSNEMLPRHVCSNGYSISYVDVSDLQKMFKRIRKSNSFGREFHYFFVSERGSKRGRPHVHGLIFIEKFKSDDVIFPAQLEKVVRSTLFKEWRRNVGSTRSPLWKPCFSYRSKFVAGKRYSNFDCHYVVPHSTEHGSDDVAFYVSKYLLKSSPKESSLQQALKLNLPDDEYSEVWNIVRSRSLVSKGFGAYTDLERDYVRYCIERSSSLPDGLKYYNSDGNSFPLSRYYRKFLSPLNAVKSVAARGGPLTIDDREMSDKIRSQENGLRIRREVADRDISDFLTYED